VYPALAVAEAALAEFEPSTLFFMGSVNGFERPLVEQSSIHFAAYDEVQAGPLHGVSPLRVLSSLGRFAVGTVQAARLLGRHRPGVVLLTGGWVGFPVALAAWLRRVPVLILLPDIEPALSIKVLRRLAAKVALSVPESAQYFAPGQTVVTGYPVRSTLSGSREAGHRHFGLDAERLVLLVFGGSRGARTINTALVGILPRLLDDGRQVLHISGELDYERVQQTAALYLDHPDYHLHAYLHDDMGLALAAADLAVSRAGASVLGEFPLFGLASVLVPYPYAWRYQKVNADYLAERGAAITMPDEHMAQDLYPAIDRLFTNPAQLATMRANAAALAQPASAQRVAALLAELAGEESTG
jgi:UDP-N-acetylglucosamine--N-acetylmuramyl-(pentapeptide) pyrophosphoryl-undecaprenol N-acetylglucosamine transferase